MSLIVTACVNDGIVMASDSRSTLTSTTTNGMQTIQNNFPLSDSSFKTFLCPNNCGISTCGAASYNNKPIAGYIENFIEEQIKKETSINEIPQLLLTYFDQIDQNAVTIFHVCGYEKNNGKLIRHAYRVVTGPNKGVTEMIASDGQGAFWNGEVSCLTKLLSRQIVNPQFIEVDNLVLQLNGATPVNINKALVIDANAVEAYDKANIAWEYMSLQDAIDFSRYAIETTVKTMQFQSVAKTVGGPIDILIITPNGARWIKHKKIG